MGQCHALVLARQCPRGLLERNALLSPGDHVQQPHGPTASWPRPATTRSWHDPAFSGTRDLALGAPTRRSPPRGSSRRPHTTRGGRFIGEELSTSGYTVKLYAGPEEGRHMSARAPVDNSITSYERAFEQAKLESRKGGRGLRGAAPERGFPAPIPIGPQHTASRTCTKWASERPEPWLQGSRRHTNSYHNSKVSESPMFAINHGW